MANTIFKDKTLLITGGTGSFGHTVLKHFLTTDIGEIRIFSRDEKKQDDMRHELQANYPDYYNKVKFYIGDVRNIQSLRDVMPGYTHNIINLSDTENLVTLMWANEPFDPAKPDTFFLKV